MREVVARIVGGGGGGFEPHHLIPIGARRFEVALQAQDISALEQAGGVVGRQSEGVLDVGQAELEPVGAAGVAIGRGAVDQRRDIVGCGVERAVEIVDRVPILPGRGKGLGRGRSAGRGCAARS
jgi:hypothetical protein